MDVVGGQILEAKQANRWDEILSTIPAMTGDTMDVNFASNEVLVLLSSFGVCSKLEITDVSDNTQTRLINATQVYSFVPGLSNPTKDPLSKRAHAMVTFDRSVKPVSVLYQAQNDYSQ